MEDWVDGVELTWEVEGDRVGAWFPYHVIWAQVLFQEFLGWSSGSKTLCLDVGLVANVQLRGLQSVFVCILLIPFLSLCDVLLQLCLDMFQVSHKHLCFGQQCFDLWVQCKLQVIPFVCEKWGHPCHC